MRRIPHFLIAHSNTLCVSILVLGCTLHFIAGYTHFDVTGAAYGTDDAYISYRYAQNLVQGAGLVFNPGERVEGYSNFLYVLMMAPAFLMTHGLGVYVYSSVFNLLCALGAYWIFRKWICRSFSPPVIALASFLFVVCPVIWLWAASGMETIWILMIQLVIWAKTERCARPDATARDVIILCFAIAASVLSRADGFILPLLALGYLLLKGRYKTLAWCAVTFGVVTIAYVMWRYSYYGYFLPNTYYAKVSGPLAARIEYALQLLLVIALSEGLFLYLVGAWAIILLQWRHGLKQHTPLPDILSFAHILFLALLGYWIYIGGDNFHERFLLLFYPLGIYLIFQTIGQTAPKAVLVALTGVLAILQLTILVTDGRFQYTLPKYDRWVMLGEYLAEHHAGQTLAIDAAGKVPFVSGLSTIDMFGLNDAFIAHQDVETFTVGHNTVNPVYVLSRQPQLIAGGIDGAGLNLNAGLNRKLYLNYGYELKYLVSTEVSNMERIIDVSQVDPTAVGSLVEHGYRYGVLQKHL
jgi:arabinofuranosyltransferase